MKLVIFQESNPQIFLKTWLQLIFELLALLLIKKYFFLNKILSKYNFTNSKFSNFNYKIYKYILGNYIIRDNKSISRSKKIVNEASYQK